MQSAFLYLFIVLLTFPLRSSPQISKINWEKQTQLRGIDFYTDVIEDATGGYTVVGSRHTTNNSLDFWIVRYTNEGDTIWTRNLGTADKDIPKRIIQLADNSYIVLGSSEKDNTNCLFLIRISENGDELWQKVFDSAININAEDLVSLDEKSFVLAGSKGTNSENVQLWMAAINVRGEIIWEKTFEDKLQGCFKSLKKMPAGGYALAGQVSDSGKNNCDMLVMRTTADGSLTWSSRIKTPGQKVWPECICCSPDSCFMLVGWQGNCIGGINTENPLFDFDLVLTKINCEGKVQWTRNFDREGSEGGHAVTICPDGSFLVAGVKLSSFLGKIGPWLLQVDPQGTTINEVLLKFRFQNDHAAKIINCSDGGFVVIGPGIQEDENIRSDGWIIKFAAL